MIKGIGIILMVMGHSGFPFTKYIYLFHMSIFFIASGYLYKDKDSDTLYSIFKFIFRKIKSLWLPYVGGMILFTMFHNVFMRIGIYCSKENCASLPDYHQVLIEP